MICPACSAEIPDEFKFCGHCGAPLEKKAPVEPLQADPVAQHNERREVVVLFADVSGFTAMSEKMDPEEVHTIMNDIFEGLGQAIHEQGGYIDKYIGDNVMALFGAPVAHEDDPARACRAALAMQQFLSQFAEKIKSRIGVHLRMRMGLNCGRVIAGGIGSKSRMDYSVMGDTVNVASRLESSAPPGGILVSREVARRTVPQFEFGPVQYLKVKGKQMPIEALVLLREVNPFLTWANDDLSIPFVGRNTELCRLAELLEASPSQKCWVEIVGEMGFGKTRLAKEAIKRVNNIKLLPVLIPTHCRNQPFSVIRLLIQVVIQDLSGRETPPASFDEFAAVLKPLCDDLDVYLQTLWFISAPRSISVPVPDSDPQTVRRLLEKGTILLLRRFAGHVPNKALFLDSYQFTDDASLSLLESLGMITEGLPLTVIAATRERKERSIANHVVIHLEPLSLDLSKKLIAHLTGGTKLSEAVLEDVLRLANGVPLHLVELVRSLLDMDRTSLGETGADKAAISLPASILSTMVSRIDRLGAMERELLCQCSVQGDVFDAKITGIVRRNSMHGDFSLETLFANLESRGFIKKNQVYGKSMTNWVFCQPLMREACYQNLSLRNRRELHALSAEAMVEVYGSAIVNYSEQLAMHRESAGQWRLAAEAHMLSAGHAGKIFINDQAVLRYRRAAEIVDNIEAPEPLDIQAKVDALAGAIRILLRVGNYDEAEQNVRQMESVAFRAIDQADANRFHATICAKKGATKQSEQYLLQALDKIGGSTEFDSARAWVLFDLAGFYFRAGELEKAKDNLRSRGNCQGLSDSLESIHADILEGKIAHAQGRFDEASGIFLRVYQIAEKNKCLSALSNACINLGNVTRDQGDYPTAYKRFNEALRICEEVGIKESIAGIQVNLGNLALSQGQLEEAYHHHQKSYAAFREMGNINGIALSQINMAVASLEKGDARRAVESAQSAIATLGDSDNAMIRGVSLVVLGESYLLCDEMKKAEEIFESILRDYDRANHQLAVAGSLRGLGRIALKRNDCPKALERLDGAVEIYERLRREQEALRTILWRAEAIWKAGDVARGRSEIIRAREHLQAIGASLDVNRANQLLDELSKAG